MGDHISHIDEFLYPVMNVADPRYPQLGSRVGPYFAQGDTTPIYLEVGQRVKPPKQAQFHWATDHFDEVGTGGAAGPGKSFVLMKSHIRKHLKWMKQGIVGVNTGMFCATLKDVERRHTDLLDKMIPPWMGSFNSTKMVYKFKKKWGGGRIYFCNTDDPEKYRSVQFAYITIDECTQIDEVTYLNIKARLRWPGISDLCIASATNPGGIGHKWYYRRLVDPATRIRPKYLEEYQEWTRGAFFIQALPTENPFLDKTYYMNLDGLPPRLRDALKNGKWDVFEGQFFDQINPAIHCLKRFKIPDEWPKYFAVDLGGAHPTACGWFAVQPPNKEFPRGRIILYRYYEEINKDVAYHKRRIAEYCAQDKNIVLGGGGHDMWANKHYEAGQLKPSDRFNADDEFGAGLNMVKINSGPGTRINGWRAVNEALSFDAITEVNERGEFEYKISRYPQLFFFSDLEMYLKSMTSVIHKEGNPEDLEKTCGNMYAVGEGDEAPDVTRYALAIIEPEEFYEPAEEKPPSSPYSDLSRYAPKSNRNSGSPYSRF